MLYTKIFLKINEGCRTLSGVVSHMLGFPGGTRGEEGTCRCRRGKGHEFDPWLGKIPWRRAWQPTPEELGRLRSVGSKRVGHDRSDSA